MSGISRENVESAIKQYIDPWLEQDLVSAKCVKKIDIDGDKVSVDVVLGFPAKGYVDELKNKLTALITAL